MIVSDVFNFSDGSTHIAGLSNSENMSVIPMTVGSVYLNGRFLQDVYVEGIDLPRPRPHPMMFSFSTRSRISDLLLAAVGTEDRIEILFSDIKNDFH